VTDISFLNRLRRLEIERVLPDLAGGTHVLEFGSGTGEQARFLVEQGFKVTAIDLASSNYADLRLFPVQDYDGRNIPLPDRSVDVIYSSNVLEHVENFDEVLAEFRRVLKPDGYAVHVLPTTAWRFWTFASAIADSLKAAVALPVRLARPAGQSRARVLKREIRHIGSGFIPRAHGTAPEGISELWSFSTPAWKRKFRRCGFRVMADRPMGLFYTGTTLAGDALSIETRGRLSRLFGSATRVYLLKVDDRKAATRD